MYARTRTLLYMHKNLSSPPQKNKIISTKSLAFTIFISYLCTMKRITSLPEKHIFVFGSNTLGRHGKGAAKDAYTYFGAIYGQGEGLQNRSYAIPTKDGKTLKTLPLETIQEHINNFIDFAISRPDLTFVVTPVGTGLAGIDPKLMRALFPQVPPENVLLIKEPRFKYKV